MKMRKYLNAVLGPVLLLDLGVQAEEVEPASFSHQDQPLPCGADSGAQYVQQRPAVKPTSECAPQAWSGGAMEEPPQNVAASRPSTAAPLAQGSSDPSQSHVAVMPKSTPGGSLRRRPSTRVVPQKTIPEEPSTTTPPASPAEEADKVIPPNLVDQEALPNMIPRPAETPDEGEEIMSYIHSFAEKSKEKLSRLVPDDPYSTQRTYGVIGTVSMPEPRDRLIVVEQNLSVEMQPIGTSGFCCVFWVIATVCLLSPLSVCVSLCHCLCLCVSLSVIASVSVCLSLFLSSYPYLCPILSISLPLSFSLSFSLSLSLCLHGLLDVKTNYFLSFLSCVPSIREVEYSIV